MRTFHALWLLTLIRALGNFAHVLVVSVVYTNKVGTRLVDYNAQHLRYRRRLNYADLTLAQGYIIFNIPIRVS